MPHKQSWKRHDFKLILDIKASAKRVLNKTEVKEAKKDFGTNQGIGFLVISSLLLWPVQSKVDPGSFPHATVVPKYA